MTVASTGGRNRRRRARSWAGTSTGRALVAAACVAVLVLAAGCRIGFSVDTPELEVIRVGVTPKPGGQILGYVRKTLASSAGLDVKVVEFPDDARVRAALSDKRVDAALVHDRSTATTGAPAPAPDPALVLLTPVHLEPLGLYSSKARNLQALVKGGRVLLSDEPDEAGRAIRLLADAGIVRLREGTSAAVTVRDITANPNHVRIDALSPDLLARSYRTGAAVVLPAATAREAGLEPGRDALALERAVGSPSAAGLAVRAGDENDPAVVKLTGLMRSQDVKAFIKDTFQQAVLPAF